ncbi:MAG: TolB family protein [Micromonosporaceae bacterium]
MNRSRYAILAVAVLALAAVAAIYTVRATHRQTTPAAGSAARLDLAAPGQIVFRDAGTGRVAAVPMARPGGPRTVSGLACQRVSVAAGRAVCLTQRPGALDGFDAVLLDRRLRETRRVKAPGAPNRARLAPDGRRVAWTAFVTGHSYARSGFSTRTSILDLGTGRLYGDIESLTIVRDGARVHAPDTNLWGVTFAPGRDTFYASLATGGRTYLLRGDIGHWQATTLRTNAECPSLSPGGGRLAFKKRIASGADRPWRLHVLDLATMAETPLPGTEGIDDQAAWLDDDTVMYALPRPGGGSDVWASAADGSGTPRLLIRDASSPSVIG